MITDEQIDSLFVFCRKHYVRAYDLQVELVDHLTAAIEDKMDANPKLSFEKALEEVFKGFGIKGFADIVSTRARLLEKKWSKERWRLFFSYFTLPKVAFTGFIFVLLLVAGKIVPVEYRLYNVLIVMVALIIFDISCIRNTKRISKGQQKELLYTSTMYEGILVSGIFLQLVLHPEHLGLAFSKTYIYSDLHYSIIMFVVVIMFVSMLAQQQFVKKLFTSAKELYPLAFT